MAVTRRRAILILVVVALAVAVLVPLLRSRPEVPVGLRGAVVSIDFADPSHGYAVLTDCALIKPGCRWRMDATRDGVTWLPRATPELTDWHEIVVDVLGRDTVVLSQGGVRWLSKDEARTWQRLQPGLASPADSIPAGGKMSVGCSDWRAVSCANQQVLVIVPETGAVAPLVHQPAVDLRLARAQPVPAADGSWWLAAHDEASKRSMLAVSRDDGRSWTVSAPLTPHPEISNVTLSEVVSGGDGYHVFGQVWQHGSGRTPVLAVYRSADGRDWDMTQLDDRHGGVFATCPIVTSAGDVFLPMPGQERPVLVSRDGGRNFEPADGPRLDRVTWTRAGYLNAGNDLPARYSLSKDGISWRDLGG